jgi:hypothetical protein
MDEDYNPDDFNFDGRDCLYNFDFEEPNSGWLTFWAIPLGYLVCFILAAKLLSGFIFVVHSCLMLLFDGFNVSQAVAVELDSNILTVTIICLYVAFRAYMSFSSFGDDDKPSRYYIFVCDSLNSNSQLE